MTKHPKKQAPRKKRSSGLSATIERHARLITIATLVMIFVVGFVARYEDFAEWQKPELRSGFFFDDQPLLATADGYYYLQFARDLSEGNYESVDSQRQFPNAPPRPSPPPLLSALTAGLHGVSGVSLDWIAIFLSVLLAPLLLVPLYHLVRISGGGRVMGLAAGIFAVCSEYYAGRTRIGSFDTDCLIVTLVVTVCYCVVRFAQTDSARRYFYGAAGLIGYGVFWWWWDTGSEAVSAICIAMFAIAVAFFYRPPRREGLLFAASTFVVAVVILAWRGFDAPVQLIRSVGERLTFLSGEEGFFPATGGNIWELEVLGFARMAKLSAGNVVVFITGWVGFGWFLFCRQKRALLFAVPGALALLPFFFGNRFLVFQVPILAIGIGYLCDRMWDARRQWKPAGLITPVVAILPAVLCFSNAVTGVYGPRTARSVGAFKDIIGRTPENAIIWNDWYHGHPLLYYTRRAAVTDALSIQGDRLVYQNMPLAASDPRLSANFMQFWVGRGALGMETLHAATNEDPARALSFLVGVCAAGPTAARARIEAGIASGLLTVSGDLQKTDDWLQFFFPRLDRPLYLLMTRDMTESPEWFRLGTWNPTTRRGADAFYRAYQGVRVVDGELRGPRALRVDVAGATIHQQNPDGSIRPYPLTQLVTRVDSVEVTAFDNTEGFSFEWVPALGFGAAMSPAIAQSMFNKMFIRHEADPRYFRPVSFGTPAFQIWQVRGESAQ